MCWTSYKKPIKQIADRDITVYKIVHVDKKGVIHSPLRGYTTWKLNHCINKINIETPVMNAGLNNSGSTKYQINKGYHSVSTEPCIMLGVWCTLKSQYPKTNVYLLLADKEYNVAEAVIPKRSIYYENENGEIVSNNLKLIKIINHKNYKSV